jgi:CRP/FNR family transcriptional regulator, cyclic AMP receptor protein
MTVVEALQKSSLFRDFTDTGLNILAGIATQKVIPEGTPLFAENMVAESMFILVNGTVRVTQKTSTGERDIARLGPGEHFGELSLLGPSVRLVSAIAASPCEVLEITQRDFQQLQPKKPQACLKLAMIISAELARKVSENKDLFKELPISVPTPK